MEANKIRLLEFIGSSKKTFNIPVYQRNYDWRDEQCRRLFNDIEKIALSNFQIEHFLGTVVYVVSHTQPNFNEYVVISNISLCRNICNYNNWNDDSIKSRALSLFKTALKIWSLPEPYNASKEQKHSIDYTTPYNIQTDINVTGEKPRQLIILDTEYSVSSWKDLLKTMCQVFFELESSSFYNLLRHNDLGGKTIAILDDSPNKMNSPHRIASGLYIETNRSALDILNYCKIICNCYQMSDEVYFTLRSK